MELSKQGISEIRLQGKKGKYYFCTEVDALLDQIGEAADTLNGRVALAENAVRENAQLREVLSAKDAEINRLAAIEAEYQEKRQKIENILLSSDDITSELVEKRKYEYDQQFHELEAKKQSIQEEIDMMTNHRNAMMSNLRGELDLLLQYMNSIDQ